MNSNSAVQDPQQFDLCLFANVRLHDTSSRHCPLFHSLFFSCHDFFSLSLGQRQLILQSLVSGGSRIFQMGGRCFVANGGVHILFSGKKCMKLKEIGLKWGAHVF